MVLTSIQTQTVTVESGDVNNRDMNDIGQATINNLTAMWQCLIILDV